MFLIIGIWGGPNRVYASYKFFLYTLLGSVLMLVALLTLYAQVGSTDIPTLMASPVARDLQMWLWLAFFASFCCENADVARAYMASRCARGSADGGFGYSRRRAFENGRVWFLRFSLPMFHGGHRVFRR